MDPKVDYGVYWEHQQKKFDISSCARERMDMVTRTHSMMHVCGWSCVENWST